jgi:hypothetical protein
MRSDPSSPDSAAGPSDLDLLRAYEPVIRFTAGELFFPVAVEDFVACCDLMERIPGEKKPKVVVPEGELTLDRLAEVGALRSEASLHLRLVEHPFRRRQVVRWRHRSGRPRFRHAARLARVGVMSRVVDALMRVSLLFRGTVARGTEAAAESLYRERMRPSHHPYYGRVVRNLGYVVLQYWFFYAFNDWRSRAYGVNDHESDWEQVTVYLAEQPDGRPLPAWVVFSAHDEKGDDLRRRWDDPDLALVGDHPVVHAGLGSHSGAYLAGEYLTTFDPPAFKGLIRFFRRITRALLAWTREAVDTGVGIPYIDYSRGDGVAIGPGQERVWSPVVIDDDTAWVFHYRGLWGDDTADPLGGERGPAGPRYERSGVVRASWGDVVGWSGLAKVAPNPVAAEQLVRGRLAELDDEVATLDAEVEDRTATLRADVASGIAVPPDAERDLNAVAAKRVELYDETRRLQARLSNAPPAPGPHDHLSHRRLPTEIGTAYRRRFLTVWSAISTPLVLWAIGAAMLPSRTSPLWFTVLLWLFILLAIEAAARKHLGSFLVMVVGLVAGVLGFVFLVELADSFGWRVAVSALLTVLALVLLVANLQELTRD